MIDAVVCDSNRHRSGDDEAGNTDAAPRRLEEFSLAHGSLKRAGWWGECGVGDGWRRDARSAAAGAKKAKNRRSRSASGRGHQEAAAGDGRGGRGAWEEADNAIERIKTAGGGSCLLSCRPPTN